MIPVEKRASRTSILTKRHNPVRVCGNQTLERSRIHITMDSFAVIPVKLPNGAEILVEARSSGPREKDVSAGEKIWDLERLREAIGGLAQLVQDAIAEVKPTKV